MLNKNWFEKCKTWWWSTTR